MCAGSTAFHANELGFRTILIDDCSRGIDMDCNSLLLLIANYCFQGINNDNIAATYNKLRSEFACVVQSSEVRQEADGDDGAGNLVLR